MVIWKEQNIYLTMHSIHFIYGYMASDIMERPTQIARGNLLPPQGLLFPISSKGYMHHPTDRKAHTMACYTRHGALVGTRNSLMGPP